MRESAHHQRRLKGGFAMLPAPIPSATTSIGVFLLILSLLLILVGSGILWRTQRTIPQGRRIIVVSLFLAIMGLFFLTLQSRETAPEPP
jgi:hypothetical protein